MPRTHTPDEAAALLGVSMQRLTWLWTAGYITETDQWHFDAGSVENYERWQRFLRALTTPLRMV